MFQSIKPFFYFVLGGLAFMLVWAAHKADDASRLQALLDSSDKAFATSDPSHTNIIISDKTFIIRAADGYTPTVKNGDDGKPTVMLKRDRNQKSAKAFDRIIVENDNSLRWLGGSPLLTNVAGSQE